jgi:hypothetical protein
MEDPKLEVPVLKASEVDASEVEAPEITRIRKKCKLEMTLEDHKEIESGPQDRLLNTSGKTTLADTMNDKEIKDFLKAQKKLIDDSFRTAGKPNFWKESGGDVLKLNLTDRRRSLEYLKEIGRLPKDL